MRLAFDAAGVAAASRLLKEGGLIAFPTDTVYGLGTDVLKQDGIERIYALKGREPGKPLPVLVESLSKAKELARFDARALALAKAFWPGALTMVLPATAGPATIGLRVPDHPLLLKLLKTAGVAMASTSANRSGQPECRSAAEVERELGRDIDCILDGGEVHGKPSTVVDLTGPELKILREGRLSSEDVLRVVHEKRS